MSAVRIVHPEDGDEGFLGTIGARFLVRTAESGGGFSLVEHKMAPRALAAPLHRHAREDEYSFILEGRMGAVLGGTEVEGQAGDLVFKPRGEWHTFWNPADTPARILEVISPGGFEGFFAELIAIGGIPEAEPAALAALADRYGLKFDFDSVPGLCERHGLRFPSEGMT